MVKMAITKRMRETIIVKISDQTINDYDLPVHTNLVHIHNQGS